MSMAAKYGWSILVGAAVGVMALGLFFLMALSSHRNGDALFSYIFPFSVITSHFLTKFNSQFAFFSPDGIRSLVAVILLLQMPVYGLILAHASVRQRLPRGVLVLGCVHLLALLTAMALGGYSSPLSC